MENQEKTKKFQVAKKSKWKKILFAVLSLTLLIGCSPVDENSVTDAEQHYDSSESSIVSELSEKEDLSSQAAEEPSIEEPSVKESSVEETSEKTAEKKKESSLQPQTSVATPPLSASELSVKNYDGTSPYAVVNDNTPYFTDNELTTVAFENYSELDYLGRCGVAYANICKEIMPTEKRESIGMVKPTGWHTVRYDDLIKDKYLYNRCHLIGYQLAGENANEKNLITGTRYLNVEGMLPFENIVSDYAEQTGNHILYRVTPVFDGNNLVADGVLMEALSVEDNGAGVKFCVFCYNIQPNITIDYATGESSRNDTIQESSKSETKPIENSTDEDIQESIQNEQTLTDKYILNTNTKKFHKPDCKSARKILDKNKKEYEGARQTLIDEGYEPCKNCNP